MSNVVHLQLPTIEEHYYEAEYMYRTAKAGTPAELYWKRRLEEFSARLDASQIFRRNDQ
jgi:hypothetical protein